MFFLSSFCFSCLGIYCLDCRKTPCSLQIWSLGVLSDVVFMFISLQPFLGNTFLHVPFRNPFVVLFFVDLPFKTPCCCLVSPNFKSFFLGGGGGVLGDVSWFGSSCCLWFVVVLLFVLAIGCVSVIVVVICLLLLQCIFWCFLVFFHSLSPCFCCFCYCCFVHYVLSHVCCVYFWGIFCVVVFVCFKTHVCVSENPSCS